MSICITNTTIINGLKYRCVGAPKITVDAYGAPYGPCAGEKWCDSWLVTYPVSYTYNGGIVVEGEWVAGYHVPKPEVPEGYKLVDIGCGLQMNARPPYATAYLKKVDDAQALSPAQHTNN